MDYGEKEEEQKMGYEAGKQNKQWGHLKQSKQPFQLALNEGNNIKVSLYF